MRQYRQMPAKLPLFLDSAALRHKMKKNRKIIPIRLRIWDFFCIFAPEMKNNHGKAEDIHK